MSLIAKISMPGHTAWKGKRKEKQKRRQQRGCISSAKLFSAKFHQTNGPVPRGPTHLVLKQENKRPGGRREAGPWPGPDLRRNSLKLESRGRTAARSSKTSTKELHPFSYRYTACPRPPSVQCVQLDLPPALQSP